MTRTKPALLTALLLALVLALPLAACSPKGPEESDPPPQTESVPPVVEPTTDPGPDESGLPVESPDPEGGDPEDPDNVAVGERDDTLTFIIEGVEETVPAVRHTSWMGYAMTYDPERFTLNEDDGGDIYLAEPQEGLPNVYLSVSIVDGLTAEETVEGLRLQADIQEEGQTVSLGANRYAATRLSWAAGSAGADAVTEYYVTEQNGTVFLIELGNFVEGQEGYGSRLSAMLDTLTF